MYKILRREDLSSNVVLMDVEAPMVAKKCLPGQFIILRVNEAGERIPLTIAGYDRQKGVITIIFQTVGATTMELAELKEGEYIADFVGPLGNPSETEEFKGKKVALIACCEEEDPAILDGIRIPYERTAALNDWTDVGQVLVPGVLEAGAVKKTDGEARAAALADRF